MSQNLQYLLLQVRSFQFHCPFCRLFVGLFKMASQEDQGVEEAILARAISAIAVVTIRRRRRRRRRSVWTNEVLLNRGKQGAYHNLIMELEDTEGFRNFFRMNRSTFNELLAMVVPYITYQDTPFRDAIKPGERLAVTLRFQHFYWPRDTDTKN